MADSHPDFGLGARLRCARAHTSITLAHEAVAGVGSAATFGLIAFLAKQPGALAIAIVAGGAAIAGAVLAPILEFLWNLGRAPRRLRDGAVFRLHERLSDLEGARLAVADTDAKAAAKAKVAAEEFADRWFTIESDGVRWALGNPPVLTSLYWSEHRQMKARCPQHETYDLKGVTIGPKAKQFPTDLDTDSYVGIHSTRESASVYPQCLADGGHILKDVAEKWGWVKFGELQDRAYNRWQAEHRKRVQARQERIKGTES